MALEFEKISDTRYESKDGRYALASDAEDGAEWHILDENDEIIAGANGDVEVAIFTAKVIAGEEKIDSRPPKAGLILP